MNLPLLASLFLSAGAAIDTTGCPSQAFSVYDATGFRGVSHPLPGFRQVQVLYASDLWQLSSDRTTPDTAYARKAAAKLPAGDLLVVDVEHWEVTGRDGSMGQAKLRELLDAVRRGAPWARVGLYGVLPPRHYWASSAVDRSSELYEAWMRSVREAAPLADAVDVLFPSLYTFYPPGGKAGGITATLEGWQRYARATVQAARLFGKPVVPFVWPRYHREHVALDTSRVLYSEDAYIDSVFWSVQLHTLSAVADGVVLWHEPARWYADAPWWRATEAFLYRCRRE